MEKQSSLTVNELLFRFPGLEARGGKGKVVHV